MCEDSAGAQAFPVAGNRAPEILEVKSKGLSSKSPDNPMGVTVDDGSGTCQWVGYMGCASNSYMYLGYAFDHASDSDPQVPLPATSFDVPEQIYGFFMAMINTCFAMPPAPADAADDVALLNDMDIGSYAPGAGNGGGDTIFRLREGIERFLISDINNPAAGAMAQSSLVVMFDTISDEPGGFAAYNHVPVASPRFLVQSL